MLCYVNGKIIKCVWLRLRHIRGKPNNKFILGLCNDLLDKSCGESYLMHNSMCQCGRYVHNLSSLLFMLEDSFEKQTAEIVQTFQTTFRTCLDI